MMIRAAKLGIMLLLGAALPAYAATGLATANKLRNVLDQTAESRVIVTFDDLNTVLSLDKGKRFSDKRTEWVGLAQRSILSTFSKRSAKPEQRYKHLPQMAMSVDREALEQLLINPNITVNLDTPRKLLLGESVPLVYSNQSTSPYNGNNEWAVAVLDSGVDKNHSFLNGKVIAEACFSNKGAANGSGSNSVCPNGLPSQVGTGAGVNCSVAGCDHGTLVAGVAVGNDGSAPFGVAKSGKIISIQVTTELDETGAYDFDVCDPLDKCVRPFSSDYIGGLDHVYTLSNTHKIAAVNLSIGSGGETGFCDAGNGAPEKVAIDLLRSAGIPTVVSAGDGGSINSLTVPACVSSAIAVSSTLDTSDVVSGTANNSVALDLYAPGENILSSVPGGGFAINSGTSMAAPHVAGAFAVIRHAAPDATLDSIETLLKTYGPNIHRVGTVPSLDRTRLDISAALNNLGDLGVVADDQLCFPVKTSNGKVAVICL